MLKRTLFVGVMVASVASASSYAMEISKGKLLSHKEWTQGNVTLTIKDKPVNLANALAKFKQRHTKRLDQITDVVNLGDAIGVYSFDDNEPATIQGVSNVTIYNDAPTAQTYTIDTHICTFRPDGKDGKCGYSQDNITLESNGFLNMERMPMLYETFDVAGIYLSVVETQVTKPGLSTAFSSYADSYVYVEGSKK